MGLITKTKDKNKTRELLEYNRQILKTEGIDIDWKSFIKKLLKDHDIQSMLDVGCHDCSITREFKIGRKVGIDIFDEIGSAASKWCEFVAMDMRDLLYFDVNSFDSVIELDTIEHLGTIEECNKLIEDMEQVAKYLVIHMTPTDVVMSENLSSDAYRNFEWFKNGKSNLFQLHLLQLSKEYFIDKGYEVIVVGGELKNFLAWKVLNKGEK